MTAFAMLFRRRAAGRLAVAATVVGVACGAPPASGQQGDVFPGGDVIVTPPTPSGITGGSSRRSATMTPTDDLFAAVAANDFPRAQAAVTAGADIDARNRWGLGPIDIAVDKGFYQIAHFLLSMRNLTPDTESGPSGNGTARGDTPPDSPFLPRTAAAPRPVEPNDTLADLSEPLLEPAAAPVADPRYAWPEDQPNPFDPANPAPGAALPVTGDIRVP